MPDSTAFIPTLTQHNSNLLYMGEDVTTRTIAFLGHQQQVRPLATDVEINLHEASANLDLLSSRRISFLDTFTGPIKLDAIWVRPKPGAAPIQFILEKCYDAMVDQPGVQHENQWVKHFEITPDVLFRELGVAVSGSLLFSAIVSLNHNTARLAQPDFSIQQSVKIVGYDLILSRQLSL